MTDTITLPREVGEYLMEVLEESPHHGDWSPRDCVALDALRKALAAPKLEPPADDDDEEFTHEDVSTLLLEVMDWTYAKAHRNRLMTEAEQKVLADIRKAIAAPTVKESLTHPGYVIGSHWLETAYSRVCAGEAEADVLRDCGWERVDEILRRDADRMKRLSSVAAELHRQHEEIEQLRELLIEARKAKWLVVQNNLLDRIDAALRREET